MLTNAVTDYRRTLHFINVYIIFFFIYNIDIFHFYLPTDTFSATFFRDKSAQICFFLKRSELLSKTKYM
jgi:hypothetical protein